jgi:hypothetical protein
LVAHIRKMVRRNDTPQPGGQKKIKLNNTAPLLS